MHVTISNHQTQIKLHWGKIFPLIPGHFKRTASSLYLRLVLPMRCPRVFEIEALPRKRGAHVVADTQYPTRCRLSLKKESTIGLDTKIRAVFVLISLVTQGAFESAGERKFEQRKRGRGEGQLSCGPDAALETGAGGLRSGGCLDMEGSQPGLKTCECMCVAYWQDCFVPKIIFLFLGYHWRNPQCHLYMRYNLSLNLSDLKSAQEYSSGTVVEAQEWRLC